MCPCILAAPGTLAGCELFLPAELPLSGGAYRDLRLCSISCAQLEVCLEKWWGRETEKFWQSKIGFRRDLREERKQELNPER